MPYDEKQLLDAYRRAEDEIKEAALCMLENSAKRNEQRTKANRKKWAVIQGGSGIKTQNEASESITNEGGN